MTNGRGFVALAVHDLRQVDPVGLLGGGAVLWLCFTALQNQISLCSVNRSTFPTSLSACCPTCFTILVLAVSVERSRVPAADGVPYTKE